MSVTVEAVGGNTLVEMAVAEEDVLSTLRTGAESTLNRWEGVAELTRVCNGEGVDEFHGMAGVGPRRFQYQEVL